MIDWLSHLFPARIYEQRDQIKYKEINREATQIKGDVYRDERL